MGAAEYDDLDCTGVVDRHLNSQKPKHRPLFRHERPELPLCGEGRAKER